MKKKILFTMAAFAAFAMFALGYVGRCSKREGNKRCLRDAGHGGKCRFFLG